MSLTNLLAVARGDEPADLLGAKHFAVLMHASKSHPYLQIADYLCWAMYVRRARNEERPYRTVQHLLRSEREVWG